MTTPVERMNILLDRLDTEDNEQVRADLRDEALTLADSNADAAKAAREYGLPA